MGTCSKCGRAESKAVPLAFVWDVWKYKEVCRYGCKDRAGSPLEVAYCFSCGKAVELVGAKPHICGPCYDGVPKASAAESLYHWAGKPLTSVLAPAPVVKEPIVEVKPAAAKTDAKSTMKDWLAVEIDECAGTLKIVKQRCQKLDAYDSDNIYRFKASNGITLESRVYPDYVPRDKTLYLRGYDTSRDADVIRVPIPHIPDIIQAVAEYNEFWSKKNV